MEIEQIFPVFEEGRILKRDSLDFIRDYAPDFFRLLYGEYGNGVIAGAGTVITKDFRSMEMGRIL